MFYRKTQGSRNHGSVVVVVSGRKLTCSRREEEGKKEQEMEGKGIERKGMKEGKGRKGKKEGKGIEWGCMWGKKNKVFKMKIK